MENFSIYMKNPCFENKPVRLGFLLILASWMYSSAAMSELKEVNTNDLKQFVDEGVAVVDVRTPGEWRATGVIPDSKLLTFFDQRGSYNLKEWLSRFGEIAQPADRIVIICQVGNRSRVIADFLYQEMGYLEVYNAPGGIEDWRRLGGAVERWPSGAAE